MDLLESLPILKVRLQHERHVVHARQRAREVGELLGFDHQTQVRLATAVSEVARNAFRYARNGVVEFGVSLSKPQRFVISVADSGKGITNLPSVLNGTYVSRTGLGKGLQGTKRLMDTFEIETGPGGTHVRVSKYMPAGNPPLTADRVRAISQALATSEVDAFEEVERQNQELLRTLEELREKQEQLAQVNLELEDTNRGVVALYAELEQNANELRRVSELKTSFLSNLSHEFRTPLNSILALCRILFEGVDGDLSTEQAKQVSYIQRSASDLSELVNDLLDLAKVEAGKIDIHPRTFTVTEMFAGLRGILRTLLVSKAVELSFVAQEELPPLHTDERKVSQILRNLISNALKFTERGSVHVSAERRGTDIVFCVRDDGIGIAPEDHERVFQEFEQVDSDIQMRVQGTGLGLPLARKLATLLGGTLELTSAVGQGSTFTATIPIEFVPGREQDPPTPNPTTDAGPLALLVEETGETRSIHETALKGSGLALASARNLSEARAFLATDAPEIIILDRTLEGGDSLPFIAELRSAGFRGGVLVLSVQDDSEESLRAGADAFLCKPIDPAEFSTKVSELLTSRVLPVVMLVDDDEINRYLLREALEVYRFQLLEARSGREALELASTEQLSLIILDVAMPGFNGLETLREFREGLAATKDVPIIIHTSKDLSSQDTEVIERYGAMQFSKQELGKSDSRARLRGVLREAGLV